MTEVLKDTTLISYLNSIELHGILYSSGSLDCSPDFPFRLKSRKGLVYYKNYLTKLHNHIMLKFRELS